MRFARASSPQAQRNSSKPSGFSLRGVSSEGITMPSTFLRIEMSDPRLQIVVAPVGDELLDELARRGEALHLVEDDEGVAAGQAGARVGLEVHEERVDVRAVHAEQVLYVLGRLGEVDDEVAGRTRSPRTRGRVCSSPCAGPPPAGARGSPGNPPSRTGASRTPCA